MHLYSAKSCRDPSSFCLGAHHFLGSYLHCQDLSCHPTPTISPFLPNRKRKGSRGLLLRKCSTIWTPPYCLHSTLTTQWHIGHVAILSWKCTWDRNFYLVVIGRSYSQKNRRRYGYLGIISHLLLVFFFLSLPHGIWLAGTCEYLRRSRKNTQTWHRTPLGREELVSLRTYTYVHGREQSNSSMLKV